MPQLTDEQKEQLKMSHRAAMRIDETWSLYTMFLSQDKRPLEALERAQEAVGVWVEWLDNNEVEAPEIERQDIGEQMTVAMQKIVDTIKTSGVPTIPFYLPQGPVDAEFVPALEFRYAEADGEVASLATQSAEPATETGTLNTKEPIA
jgi:hypothetical protein